MTLTDFVLARIAEREAVARAATPGPWRSESDYEDAGAIYTDAPLDSLPLKDDTWTEDHQRSIASESAWGDIRIQDAAHIALWDPAAVLARCAVDRQIVAEHQQGTFTDVSLGLKDVAVCIKCHSVMAPPDEDDEDSWGSTWDDWKYPFVQDPWPCRTLRLLASLDADHPDYDDAWDA